MINRTVDNTHIHAHTIKGSITMIKLPLSPLSGKKNKYRSAVIKSSKILFCLQLSLSLAFITFVQLASGSERKTLTRVRALSGRTMLNITVINFIKLRAVFFKKQKFGFNTACSQFILLNSVFLCYY